MNKVHVGAIFGRLTVTEAGKIFAVCQCACGGNNGFICRANNLRNGATKSCGCLRREVGIRTKTHGMTKTPEYRAWQQLRSRCNDPLDKSYKDYGGRGITVCERWGSFENFIADMGARPAGMSIDRRENDGPYSPENCHWATRIEQTRNRRIAVKATYRGETKPLQVWCDLLGMDYSFAHRRLRRMGQDPEQFFPQKEAA